MKVSFRGPVLRLEMVKAGRLAGVLELTHCGGQCRVRTAAWDGGICFVDRTVPAQSDLGRRILQARAWASRKPLGRAFELARIFA